MARLINRRTLLAAGPGVLTTLGLIGGMGIARASEAAVGTGALDAKAEARKIAFDRVGKGDVVFMISGFPSTRRSWKKLIPLLSKDYQCVPADLPSFGDSGFLAAPATTENVARVFHEFSAANFSGPVHVIGHDVGAWCAATWALLFPGDFRKLTLIDAGIPGMTLANDVQLTDYFRKWNFMFHLLPTLPGQLTQGKEDIYVGWWFANKVHTPGSVPPGDVAAYVRAYARPGRMDAAFDYFRQILKDMDFNKGLVARKSTVPLLAVGGEYAIPEMGQSLKPYFENVTGVVVPNSGHFVPEEQPEALFKALKAYLV